MDITGRLVYTLMPIILAGVCNMLLVRAPIFDHLKRPMDGGILYTDGKRLFGDNKTWKGFLGMVVLSAFWMWAFGVLDDSFSWARGLSLIPFQEYSPFQELAFGALWGLGYVLFELPNSFIKRRIGIPPGRNTKGGTGLFFRFLDQADSVIGCILFMFVFYVPSPSEVLAIFAIGVAIHYGINILLYTLGLKGQAG